MNTHSTHLIPADLDESMITMLQSLESKIRDKTGSEVVLLAYRSTEHDASDAKAHV
ncbi:hypothetical protein [Paenibacillus terrigena]|uniref:hypothetical protein n=1 Tax=Paenibacillus terrigena TaxID=369333 RepID=UPI00035E565B|nr:hypothetical protein [Paenibacillus terrigena]